MSRDFTTSLVKDERLMTTDIISYAVQKGAQQISSASFEATSQSPSSIVFNIVVPSLETIVDRNVMFTSTVTLRISATTQANQQVVNYGERDSLASYPLTRLITSMSATINNNTLSVNTKDIFPPMLRMLDQREMSKKYNTVNGYDIYGTYSQMEGTQNNQFGGFDTGGPDSTCKNFGAYALDSVIDGAVGGGAMGVAAGPKTALVTFTVTEPLFLSPFLFGNASSNQQGLYGIQNMSFMLNMDATARRVWRHFNGNATPGVANADSIITNIELLEFKSSKLNFNFLTAHPSSEMTSRNCVPYYDIPRYLSTSTSPIPASVAPAFPGAPIIAGSQTYQSTTISLSQIPDKIIIFAKKKDQNWYDSDAYLAIDGISMNFNNSSGLLSSFTAFDLWKSSVSNGSNQTWEEFRGYAYRANPAAQTVAGAGAGKLVHTSGSILVLEPSRDISLVQEFYSAGSIGNFTLQFEIRCKNYSSEVILPEICVITVNSGVFACERGTSSTYTALLTKDDVLEASTMEPISRSEVRRLVGSGFLDSLKSAWNWLSSGNRLGKIANTALNIHDIYKSGPTSASTKGRQIVGALGGARSGGDMYGSAMTGGSSLMSRLR